MGKLAIMSDLHVDINHFTSKELQLIVEVLLDQRVTHLHLAGDTANQVARCLEVVAFFQRAGVQTTFNFGNHELPGLKSEQQINHYPAADFLNDQYRLLSSTTALLGITGWYDYSFSVHQDQQKDVRLKNLYWYDRMIERQGSDQEVMETILIQTKQQLEQLKEQQLSVIVATHFVPKREFIYYQTGKYQRWNALNAFLGSEDLGKLFDSYDHIQQVVFGHTHRRQPDQVIHGTVYSCRPLGYYYEWQLTRRFVLENQLMETYHPMKARGVIRAHREAFTAYQFQWLKTEILQAMTVIAY